MIPFFLLGMRNKILLSKYNLDKPIKAKISVVDFKYKQSFDIDDKKIILHLCVNFDCFNTPFQK